MRPWWNLNLEDISSIVRTDFSTGLTQAEAQQRLSSYGPNQLTQQKKKPPFFIFLAQFDDFIIWVLVGAALVSGFLREWIDAAAIIAIVAINAVLGFLQEYRAEKALAALKKLSSPSSKVIRERKICMVPSEHLVPGDIIELESGDNVPADSRLVYVTGNFSAQEASLTGESTPVAKQIQPLAKQEVSLADRTNMVYMGTFVASGKAKAVVVETGMKTELGKVAGLIQTIEGETTPLQKKLEEFGKWIVYACFVLVAVVFILGVIRGGTLIDMFLTAVSLAVAAIPEGLPAVVTIALALGVQRMVKRHALIRKLPSVETLGCATVICSDKTGTLTKNEMTVQRIYADGDLFTVSGVGYEPKGIFSLNDKEVSVTAYPVLQKTLMCGVLCNGALLASEQGMYKIVGDPTEGALLSAAGKAGLTKEGLENDYSFVAEIPFDSERKMMTLVRKHRGAVMAFVKGAPEIVMERSSSVERNGSVVPLTAEERQKILAMNTDLANQAMRVLAVACRSVDPVPAQFEASLEKELIFVGLVAMIDPPREEVKQAIKECSAAGIRAIMITGDHKNTALAIARDLGIIERGSVGLSGEELDHFSEEEFARKTSTVSVYARVAPEHKLRIVRALKKQGHTVAMTGDGVNDAPAVKEADIGVAMGITGTDVTKEVSDMIITDDNFASIVAAVEEGRGIYDNIKKFIHYLLSCNVGEILVMFLSTLFGLPIPLLPIHILWVNLVTDSFPALALGMDPVDPDVMKRPPRPRHEPVIPRRQAMIMVLQGGFIAVCSLSAFLFVLFVEQEGIERARTAAFIVLSCSQLFHSFNCRSLRYSLFKIGIFSNKKLILAAAVSFFLQMAVVYVPFLQKVFKTEPLGLFDWVFVIIVSSFPLWAMEIVKILQRSKVSPVSR